MQCNLDLVTLNLVTTCDLVTILQRPFFNLLHKIIRFSDIMRFSDSFCRDQNCHYIEIALYFNNQNSEKYLTWPHIVDEILSFQAGLFTRIEEKDGQTRVRRSVSA